MPWSRTYWESEESGPSSQFMWAWYSESTGEYWFAKGIPHWCYCKYFKMVGICLFRQFVVCKIAITIKSTTTAPIPISVHLKFYTIHCTSSYTSSSTNLPKSGKIKYTKKTHTKRQLNFKGNESYNRHILDFDFM